MDQLNDDFDDDYGNEEEGEDDALDASAELSAEDAAEVEEAAEVEARRAAGVKADEVLRDFHDISDEPPVGPRGDDPDLNRRWAEYLDGINAEKLAEQQAIQAVFEAEEAEQAAETERFALEPIDFMTWDQKSFAAYIDRVTGVVPIGAPRTEVDDDKWERALELIEREA